MSAIKPLPPISRLRELFVYDPGTGILSARITRRHRVAGEPVKGESDHRGYRRIWVDNVRYLVHRICWALYYGEDPPFQIDHEDLDVTNNRLRNLRPATDPQNKWNVGLTIRNTSGVKGVSFSRRRGAWLATVQRNGKRYQVGAFESLDEAERAIVAYRARLHGEFTNHGEPRKKKRA